LELGSDDYVIKPFSPRELVARIKAVLRRKNEPQQITDDAMISIDNLKIDLKRYEVSVEGEILPFTPKETELLYKLCTEPGRVFTREQLLTDVWGYDYYGDTRVVDTQIKRIRQKLPENERWGIRSVYGVGYKFEVR